MPDCIVDKVREYLPDKGICIHLKAGEVILHVHTVKFGREKGLVECIIEIDPSRGIHTSFLEFP
ncbi:MAG: hypothetical protein A4E38_01423 [Methanoregulaceae archaeon PtaB.Bin108]|nr:MAG: hypothetical protein A4E38_01423 [Methanoregulaceae archaeon PtaB.Bin108]